MNTTLDQWEVLQAVVQLGSFAAAADRMNRSQSTISYAISRLQDQFETPLLKMKGRRAQLTETGKALLTEVEPLLTGFRTLEERASSLGTRAGTEIRLSIDSLFPEERLFAALGELARVHPHVYPKLRHGTLLAAAEEFSAYRADLCVTAFPARDHLTQSLLDIRMCGVARADHPLHGGSEPLAQADLRHHLAVVIEATSGPNPRQQPHNPSQRFVTVNTIEAAIEAVRSGLCFGWLPEYRIEPLLVSGELQRLRLPAGAERQVRLFLASKEMGSTRDERSDLASLLGANRGVDSL